MKSYFDHIRDRVSLLLFALLLVLPVFIILSLDEPLIIKDRLYYYYKVLLVFFAYIYTYRPFIKCKIWLGFRDKRPVVIGVIVNALFVAAFLIVFRNAVEPIHTPIKIGVAIMEMVLWIVVMKLVGAVMKVIDK